MTRVGLLVALLLTAVTGVAFALAPHWDIAAAAPFFDAATQRFPASGDPLMVKIRRVSMWLVFAFLVPALFTLILRALFPGRRMAMTVRASLFLIVSMAIGPGLVVNSLLKDYWGRPRPVHVTEFGGTQTFRPWWDPRGTCTDNCSFVGGESAGAFWLMAPAALAPAPVRPLAYGAAIVYGAGIGLLRMSFGAHFLSDILFSGLFTFLVIWATHALMYRWRPQWFTDAVYDRLLARLPRPWRRPRTTAPSPT